MFKIISIVCFCLFLCTAKSQSLEKQAESKIQILKSLVEKAEENGIYTEKERMTLRIAEIYLMYALWDEDNVEWNSESMALISSFKKDANKMAEGLADFQRMEVNTILQNAIDEITKLINGKYTRKTGREVEWSKAKLSGNKIIQEGRPVFLLEHFWKPASEFLHYFGMADGIYITPNHVLNNLGKISPELERKLKTKPDGNLGFIFVDNNHMPKWTLQQYDNFIKGAGVFGKYDIDHPGAKELYELLYSATVPYMQGKNYTKLGYMIFNEPSFFTEEGTWNAREVSKYTKEKFKIWLEDKHHNINALNKIWGTCYENFESIKITIPINGKLQGTPVWYDWMTFNNHRVTEWFRYLNSTIKKYDPEAPTHVKIMPWLWTEEKRDHGMDIEAVLRVTDIMGCDAMTRDSNINGKKEHWMERYSFMWEEVSLMYDFFRSVNPNQIIFDSETHFASSVHHRDLYLKADYIRVCYWLAFMHGLNASNNWIWARDSLGIPSKRLGSDYSGTNAQQPGILHSMHSTLIDLNTYSEEITSIQLQRKPLRIFYSLPNAISSKKYMPEVFKTYESLYFEGVPLGFSTAGILKKESPKEWDAILVRKTEIVSNDELNKLQGYLNSGGTLIIDKFSLKHNEYGHPHKKLIQTKGKIIEVNSLSEMKDEAMKLLSKKNRLPGIQITEANGHEFKTCIWRCINNEKGNFIVSAVNLGKTTSELQIQKRGNNSPLDCTDILTGTSVNSTTILKPFEVLFVEIETSNHSQNE